jgi:hypothetical protein
MTKQITGNKLVPCGLCGRRFKRITQKHLDSMHPGFTLEEYRRIYKATTPQGQERALALQQGNQLAQAVMEQIQADPVLMEDITKRVGENLFSDEIRGKFIGGVLAILQSRIAAYAKLDNQHSRVTDELFSDERILQGGPDGAPTDTATLIAMGRLARDNVADAEDALLRMVKLAIDDKKKPEIQRPINIFTGKHETVIVPDFKPKQREAIRRVATSLTKDKKTVRALIAKAKNIDEEEVEGKITNVEPVED